MKATSSPANTPPPLFRRPLFLAAAVAVLVLLYFLLRPAKASGPATEYHVVKRGDFTVSVIEGGTLAAVSEVIIRNEVEGTARIISIVPEGSYVKKGDLLVELDSANAQDQVNQQQIAFEKAKFAVEQARAQLEIQRLATNSEYLAAKLKHELAVIDRDKYEQGQRLVNRIEARNKLVQAQAQLAVNLETYLNSTNLAARGYETKNKVDGDRLSVTNTLNSMVVASNSLWMLEQFDEKKQSAQYESDVLQAKQDLDRVIKQNERKMDQYEADLITQSNTLVLNEDKLERDKKNLTATKVYAPQDGLVVYQMSESRFSSESLIEAGATVRNRQELIKLPDLSRMKVTVKVHESHINMIRPGLPAFVELDSMPDERFRGTVGKVAPLLGYQARFGNPNLKVYNTEVLLTDTLPNVKPGVSAKAEIIITTVANTLSVPIQAVTSYRGKQSAYRLQGNKSEPVPVEVGLFNTKFIQITKGLDEGDRVLLSPPFDTHDKDLEGAVLTDEEKAKITVTNAPPPTSNGPNGTTPTPDVTGGRPDSASGAPATFGMAPGEAGGERGAAQGRSGRRGAFNPEEMVKQFDKNGDGQLDETEREAMRTEMAARFGGMGGMGGGGQRPNREEMIKQYDKNGDGELDETEREAMRAAMAARFGGMGGMGGGRGRNREEMTKRFDKNGDGELDETERAAMFEEMRANRTDRGPAPSGGGTPPAPQGGGERRF